MTNSTQLFQKERLMRILLSVKPIFVEEIIAGHKLYEYRRQLFKHTDIKTIVIYASSPVCKIVGEFEIETIIKDSPEKVWEKTNLQSGISKAFYFKYFKDTEIAYAIKIKNFIKYSDPISLADFEDGITPPQSFRYIK